MPSCDAPCKRQGPLNGGGFKWGGFPIWTCPSFFVFFSGKKKPYTALLQCRTFLCRKKWGPQRKDFGGGYVFPGFCRVFVSTTGLESFSLRPEKFSKRFSFGGGRVGFFLLCFLSFLGLSRFFRDFPDLLGDSPGIFPICPFPLSRPISSTNEEQSRKGPRHNPDLSWKKWETPLFSFSQKRPVPCGEKGVAMRSW